MIQSKAYVSTPSLFLELRGKYEESPEVSGKDNGQSEGEDIWGGAKVSLQLWVPETQSLFFIIMYYYLLIIVLFSLPHPVVGKYSPGRNNSMC